MMIDPLGTIAFLTLLISAGIGLATSVIGQAVSDIIEGVIEGNWDIKWEEYVGAAIGGAIGGVTSIWLGPWGDAIGEVISTQVSMRLLNLTGKEKYTQNEINRESLNNGLSAVFFSFLGGKITDNIKINAEYGELIELTNKGLTKGVNKKVVFEFGIDMIGMGTKIGCIESIPGTIYEIFDKIFGGNGTKILNSNCRKVATI